MSQPTPPGDMPLYEGLGTEWNDIVGAFPEEKRAELAPVLKQRIDSLTEPYKPWEDFQKSGVSPDQVNTALQVFSVIENNPRQVYEAIGKHLGITTQQAQEMVEEIQDADPDDDPRIATLQQQVDTLAQIALAQRQQTTAEKNAAEAEAQLEKDLNDLKKKHGDFDEDEVVMRMLHLDMTPEQAYQAYEKKVNEIRSRRPAPMLLGGGGNLVPPKQIDVTKLDSAGTKNLVTQMMQHAIQEGKS